MSGCKFSYGCLVLMESDWSPVEPNKIPGYGWYLRSTYIITNGTCFLAVYFIQCVRWRSVYGLFSAYIFKKYYFANFLLPLCAIIIFYVCFNENWKKISQKTVVSDLWRICKMSIVIYNCKLPHSGRNRNFRWIDKQPNRIKALLLSLFPNKTTIEIFFHKWFDFKWLSFWFSLQFRYQSSWFQSRWEIS